ncbi:MAG: DUF4488 domain-containing protein [Sphingobacterium composti]|uniref:DUF4488 domain-containing protein n=1 Tax=Sphingobacterium composti TaxID=363260 RepID=UPI001356DCC7|nr:DUF4488 domain-containing protein [Sphingobacterium composti Ten et al. 2007 non Yoo et al. 2007]
MKKLTLLVTFLVALCTITFAQDKPLTGIWELKKTKDGQGNIHNMTFGAYKLFSNEGRFTNMRVTEKGAIISHDGIFTLNNTGNYTESIFNHTSRTYLDEIRLTLKISEDGNMLTIEGELKLGNDNTYNLYEEWKKVKVGSF